MQKQFLFILNEGPYGNERSFNGLRLALRLSRQAEAHVKIFLSGDGVQCGLAGQKTPNGYYNIERMLTAILRDGEVAT